MEFASNLECDAVSLGFEVVSTTIHKSPQESPHDKCANRRRFTGVGGPLGSSLPQLNPANCDAGRSPVRRHRTTLERTMIFEALNDRAQPTFSDDVNRR